MFYYYRLSDGKVMSWQLGGKAIAPAGLEVHEDEPVRDPLCMRVAEGQLEDMGPSVPLVPPTVGRVKAEAHRRIVAICPEYKQRNLTAQAVLLAHKGSDAWTSAEAQAWADGEAIWTRIEAIRAASNQIEAMDPIPDDFTADSYWPE